MDEYDMEHQTCAFTGHRAEKIPSIGGERATAIPMFYCALEATILRAVAEGYTVFRSGGAMGMDLLGAEIVLRLNAEYPQLQIHFILPCETQANYWPEHWRERYFHALAGADEVTYIQARYTRDCMFRRNRFLVDGAQLVIAYYDGRPTGGTAYTVRYARKKGVPVWNIHS